MVTSSITKEVAVAVPVERMWKVCLAKTTSALLPRACAGYIDAVEVDGDGGPGSIITLKLNPSALGELKTLKSHVVAFDVATRVMNAQELQGGPVGAQLKTHLTEFKVEAAGEGACVFKVKVVYERHNGAALAPVDEAKLFQFYVLLVKMVEAYLVANPDEFA